MGERHLAPGRLQLAPARVQHASPSACGSSSPSGSSATPPCSATSAAAPPRSGCALGSAGRRRAVAVGGCSRAPLLAGATARPRGACAQSTSDFVIRPAGPLPETAARSTPSTAAARAATGETFVPSGACERRRPGARCRGACGACRRLRAAAGAQPLARRPPTAMRAITWPTVTVSPSCTRISLTVPVAGDGSSRSTLSVEISTIVSSTLMRRRPSRAIRGSFPR